MFDHTAWTFSPSDFLVEERDRVKKMVSDGSLEELLLLVPGKQLFSPIAAKQAALGQTAFVKLICDALRGDPPELASLGGTLEAALAPHLPPRFAAIKTLTIAP